MTSSISGNMALNERVRHLQASGHSIVNLCFGEVNLPLLSGLAERLKQGANRTRYGSVAGSASVREAAARYFSRRGLPTRASQIIVAPGTKPLLLALQLVVPGDVILPRPAWNSYRAQASYAGKKAISLPIPDFVGGVPDPGLLSEAVAGAGRASAATLLMITTPDNPTGTYASADLLERICRVAEDAELVVVSDEIYSDLIHKNSRQPFVSAANIAPDRVVVTTGLSKNLALGGWRIGVARFPDSEAGERLRHDVLAAASEIWSTIAGPMEAVAEYVFDEPLEVTERIEASASLHSAVAAAIYASLIAAGAECRQPTAGFYLYPDIEHLRPALERSGVRTSCDLSDFLLECCGIAVLPGAVLGDEAHALRFKIATGLLYGDNEAQQLEALAARDPTALPHIRRSLEWIAEVFSRLACSN